MRHIHTIQLQILRNLLLQPKLSYSQIKPTKDMDNNLFDFHLDQMIKAGFIKKTNTGYTLTDLGKEFAGRLDTEKSVIQKQAKISVVVAPIRSFEGSNEFLIYTRLKHPFYGCQGFMSGKVNFGEQVTEAAKREFKEETNLETDNLEISSIRHYRVFNPQNELLEDKFMFFCLAQNPIGTLQSDTEGKFEWVKEVDLFSYVTNHFESLEKFRADIEEIKNFKGLTKFFEIDHFSEKF